MGNNVKMKKWFSVKSKFQDAARKALSNDEAKSVAVKPFGHTSERSAAVIQRIIQMKGLQRNLVVLYLSSFSRGTLQSKERLILKTFVGITFVQ